MKNQFSKKLIQSAAIAFKFILLGFGFLFCILISLSFTDIPYIAYHRLSMPEQVLQSDPKMIVVLGGAGMPSADGLLRTHYGAQAAQLFPNAKVILALPKNPFEKDSLYQLRLMASELVLKGVDTNRIFFESIGFNTHSQAVNISQNYKASLSENLLIVTSPEHLCRAILTFEKTGFSSVGGLATFEFPIDEIRLKSNDTKDQHQIQNLGLRYNVWSYLIYEIKVLREYVALSYYWLLDWI